ncbi:MAG: hypothetical protein IPQ04_11960 [Saprospiraceae bacterium]|nr:hypothetical protein [Saprospiraceae bacterium]
MKYEAGLVAAWAKSASALMDCPQACASNAGSGCWVRVNNFGEFGRGLFSGKDHCQLRMR